MTPKATQLLARYATGLRYQEIPPEVISRIKDCIIDTLVVTLYGSTKPWSRSVVNYVASMGHKGSSTVFGERWKTQAPQVVGEVAALAGGASAPKGAGSYVVLAIGLGATIAVTAVVTRSARRALREITGE